ncbi:MAG: hypothetical protein CK529_11420 [Rhodospirillaceae bacterium]|nr:MAG: hypothetical protein CK529_11420 [Rhodospirillaceae bacterium]
MDDREKSTPSHRKDFIPAQKDDVFLSDAALDNVTSAVIALGSEFWALQKRMNVVEVLLEDKGSVSKAMIENYRPSAEQSAAWEEQRDRFIKRVYGFLQNTHSPSKKPGRRAP